MNLDMPIATSVAETGATVWDRLVLFMDSKHKLQWTSLRSVCDSANAYGGIVSCHKSVVVGDYVTIEGR